MATQHPNLAELMKDNRRLRQAIDGARRNLDNAAASLREVLDQEVFVEGTPMEVEAAMESAADAIAAASHNLQQSLAEGTAHRIPGGPTRQQGQFLAYIREYMLRNHLGLAPTHAELQRFFNLTPPSVNSMLKRLDQRGFIRRTPGKTRAIELTIDPELIPTLDRPFKH
jgi:repressor LexA